MQYKIEEANFNEDIEKEFDDRIEDLMNQGYDDTEIIGEMTGGK